LGACGPPKPEEIAWTEDVELPDGRTVTVARMERVFERNSLSGDAGGFEVDEATLSFEGELKGLPQWRYPLSALALYEDAGQWVLVATTADCAIWQTHGKPKPLYWEFRVNEHNWWQEVPLSRSSIGLKANLIWSWQVAGRKHVTIADRRAAQTAMRADRMYREVWGEPEGFYCGEPAR
jgi:hypothetical protein